MRKVVKSRPALTGGARKSKDLCLITIAQSLSKISGYNEFGEFKDINGTIIPGTDVLAQLNRVTSSVTKLPHELDFLKLCKQAGVHESLFLNDDSRRKYRKLGIVSKSLPSTAPKTGDSDDDFPGSRFPSGRGDGGGDSDSDHPGNNYDRNQPSDSSAGDQYFTPPSSPNIQPSEHNLEPQVDPDADRPESSEEPGEGPHLADTTTQIRIPAVNPHTIPQVLPPFEQQPFLPHRLPPQLIFRSSHLLPRTNHPRHIPPALRHEQVNRITVPVPSSRLIINNPTRWKTPDLSGREMVAEAQHIPPPPVSWEYGSRRPPLAIEYRRDEESPVIPLRDESSDDSLLPTEEEWERGLAYQPNMTNVSADIQEIPAPLIWHRSSTPLRGSTERDQIRPSDPSMMMKIYNR